MPTFVACLAFLTNEFFDLQIPAIASGHRKSMVNLAQLHLFLMRVWLWEALGSSGKLWEALGVSGETLGMSVKSVRVSWEALGLSWEPLEVSWEALGVSGKSLTDRSTNPQSDQPTNLPSDRARPTEPSIKPTEYIRRNSRSTACGGPILVVVVIVVISNSSSSSHSIDIYIQKLVQ